ncbi:hypothetical protein HK097_006595 [Rhizophlyctis rosea]|uniref:Uncharacterized protein n=1 Tax=Rhizophlyctis rosea TaxID=64517 RepID=A0AAD5SCJ1_9FUNG|nr:hypothetical protein HK097_006595 [Rhizophlyctis rosea]
MSGTKSSAAPTLIILSLDLFFLLATHRDPKSLINLTQSSKTVRTIINITLLPRRDA